MPGIFGVLGAGDEVFSALHLAYKSIWGSLEERRRPQASVGGHAFRGNALVDLPDGGILARDGVARAYRPVPDEDEDYPFCGVCAHLHPTGLLRLLTDATGAFPLHFVETEAGLAFSSLLEPLARAVRAPIDPVGLGTFLRFGYTFAGRTVFKGIRRLQPGQVVTRGLESAGVELEDRSTAWGTHLGQDFRTPEETAEQAAELLVRVAPGVGSGGSARLMMSAGWDSRTLLAGSIAAGSADGLVAYSHGDLASRELRIARAICDSAGVTWRGMEIGPDVWDPDHLDMLFGRAGTLVFPHWGWAGRAAGRDCVSSGVSGEVLGGHYGETQIVGGRAKVIAYIKGVRTPNDVDHHGEVALEGAFQRLSVGELRRPWYLRPDVEGDPFSLRESVNQDIKTDLGTLVRRGLHTRERLIEAFVTEHRGAQYICAQALSARVATDVEIPFGDPDLFRFATAIPSNVKIHNRVNRALVRMLAPGLERFAMAATLVPAGWPLLLQEVSRGIRKLYEEGRWSLHRRSCGRYPAPRLGWVNFKFLREQRSLAAVVDGLRASIWDREAMHSVVRRISDDVDGRELHPLFDQFGKILTVDRLLSGRDSEAGS